MGSRRAISASLAGMFLGFSVAGCGATPAVLHASAPTVPMAQATRTGEPSAVLAQRFADAFAGDADFKAVPTGSVVTLTGPDAIVLVYDFTRTPQTGKIQVQAGQYRTEVTADTGAQRDVYWTIAKVAIRMVYGGVKAYIKYTKAHQGAIVKDDLVKAVLYGMVSQGVQGLPGGFLWKRLLPIVWEWVFNEPPITRTSIKQIYERWSRDLGKIEAILREYRQQGGTFSTP
ncbi:MAG: hypothetical protein H7338_06375 [Candidatus Sericytochromatia bacterium]|nr:hypothetical protein [Candidatus Sericytochromatia bacterium]